MDTPGTPDPFHPAESHPGSRDDDAVRRLEHVGRGGGGGAGGGGGGGGGVWEGGRRAGGGGGGCGGG
ncbi:hypothetical protein, partial [Nocardia brasiliensis]|uniref:hypothetical protein n=1 Tax=Nocardia brasiliensis TaxID=37326 RepID=UPI0024581DFE